MNDVIQENPLEEINWRNEAVIRRVTHHPTFDAKFKTLLTGRLETAMDERGEEVVIDARSDVSAYTELLREFKADTSRLEMFRQNGYENEKIVIQISDEIDQGLVSSISDDADTDAMAPVVDIDHDERTKNYKNLYQYITGQSPFIDQEHFASSIDFLKTEMFLDANHPKIIHMRRNWTAQQKDRPTKYFDFDSYEEVLEALPEA